MTEHAEKPPAYIEILPATPEQRPVLGNLLELYAHDFSEFHDVEPGADGRFGYPHLPLYWSEPDHHPFLVWTNGKLAGFAFVKKGSEVSGNKTAWDMAEFFVLRGYRRRGIGIQAAHEVWRRFPGLWEVRVMQSNGAAHNFWARAISAYVDRPVYPVSVEKGGRRWLLFSFDSTLSV